MSSAPHTALVFPPLWDTVDSPPLGPAVLAGALAAAGLPAFAFDLNLLFHEWLFADETLRRLRPAAVSLGQDEERDQIDSLLALPAGERVLQKARTAPLMALAWSLGMRDRPLLGPQRFLTGVDSSQVRLAHLIAGDESPRMRFWRGWIAAHVQPLVEAAPGTVGITLSYVGQLMPAILLAQHLKAVCVEPPRILLGGPWCTHQAVSGIDLSPLLGVVDGVCVGPGEEVITHVAAAPRGAPVPAVAGLWQPTASCPDKGRPRPASPDWSVFALDRYPADEAPQIPLESSRGCWAACRYCNYPALNRGYFIKPISQVVAEVEDALARQPGARITFVDDTILPKKALKLADALGQLSERIGQRVRWSGCIRPDARLNAAQCLRLAAGGCHRVFIGFDAATQDMLDGINKRASIDEVKEMVGYLKAAGITVAGNFILRLPGEQTTDRAAIEPMMEELGLDPEHVTTSLFAVVRGSWFYEHMDELGWPGGFVEQVRQNDVLTDFIPAHTLKLSARNRATQRA